MPVTGIFQADTFQADTFQIGDDAALPLIHSIDVLFWEVQAHVGAVLLDPQAVTTIWNPSRKGNATVLAFDFLTVSVISEEEYDSIFSATAQLGSGLRKVYTEHTLLASAFTPVDGTGVGLGNEAARTDNYWVGQDASSIGLFTDGRAWAGGALILTSGFTFQVGDTIGQAWDQNLNKVWWRVIRNSTVLGWLGPGVQDPVTGAGGFSTASLGSGNIYTMFSTKDTSVVMQSNFGRSPFAAPIPASYEFWDEGSAVKTLRFSTHSFTTTKTDVPSNTFYMGSIIDPGGVDRAVFDGAGATSGDASADFGFVELANTGQLDELFDYGWGRQATLKATPQKGLSVSGAETLLKCIVTGIESSDATTNLRFKLRGRLEELGVPLLSERYAGTTVSLDSADQIEGDAELTGQIKQHVYGKALSVGGKLVNKFMLIYQFANNPINGLQVFDGGLELDIVQDFGTLEGLISYATTIAPGEAATCLARGLAMLGAEPAFKITANVYEGAEVVDRSAARISRRLLSLVSSVEIDAVDEASFDTFHNFNPASCGIVIADDRTATEAISQVANSVGGVINTTALGVFEMIYLDEPSTVDADIAQELTLRDLLLSGSLQLFTGVGNDGSQPAWSVVVNWGRIWDVQSTGDLAPIISEATDGTNLALKQLLGTEFRQAVAEDGDVLTVHPRAVQLTFETALTEEADALAEAARRLALYSVRRDRIQFPVSFARDTQLGNVALGATVRVTMDRFGYGGGKSFIVLGRKDDYKLKQRTLTLWG